ncbi:transposase [Labrys sp. LIt4]|uniref:REP-associated tyrosine transposase n=1 Tax=Labrys sp. LIt4 TaxID=2821355 RepID=UPI001AE07CA3|nr:transposase [Labrys sp. LIt4]MBP0579425.1 transposase [Labrys sp. LIt4]
MRPLPEWHSRGYLPHWEAGETPQSITFRLADSLPRHVVEKCLQDISDLPDDQAKFERRKHLEEALDRGYGEAFLTGHSIGRIVSDALLHFDGERYRLHAWCIMPNHVHVLATPLDGASVAGLAQSWKGFTARHVNQYLGRSGPVWFRDYFDRRIRNERHFEAARFYIENNPVKAGLCEQAHNWPWSSASHARMIGHTAG